VVDLTDEEMLAELGIDIEAKKLSAHTPQEERIIAGFEDIQRFVDEHKRFPEHGEGLDIFERLYAARCQKAAYCLRRLIGRDCFTLNSITGLLRK
jgi:hypothetical protein